MGVCALADAEADLLMLKEKTSRVWVVCNKMDLVDEPARQTWREMVTSLGLEEPWFVSAKDLSSVKELRKSLESRFLSGFGDLADQTVVTNVRHAESLQQCSSEMEHVLTGMDSGFTGDLLAFHYVLESALWQVSRVRSGLRRSWDLSFRSFVSGSKFLAIVN
jgi:tRNA U34 5-carboxymethylaminomethyl modifying GTPase MnmE/TrmE